MKINKRIGILLLLIVLVLMVWQRACGVAANDDLVAIPFDDLPPDTLYITEGRLRYENESMRLLIPSIGVNCVVGDSTDAAALQARPGLYEYAQLPGEGNVNVSIAGHRDIYGMEFYHLDKVVRGDALYLLLDGLLFRYEYLDTRIVAADDWSVIQPQGFSCLTLTTCDPIGTTRNRLIVRAELMEITIYSAGTLPLLLSELAP